MNKLILHIGTHKTASTTIQSILKSNEFKINSGFKTLDPLDMDNIPTLLKNKNKNKNYIISYEGFSGNMHKDLSLVKDRLTMFKKVENSYEIIIIVCYREQVDFLQSTYAQFIHEGGSCSFQYYFDQYNLDSLNYYNHVQLIKEAIPSGSVMPIIYDVDVVSQFMNVINFEGDVKATKSKNVSYNINAIEFACAYNNVLNSVEKKKLRVLLQESENKSSGAGFVITKILAEKIRVNFKESNLKLCKEYNLQEFKYKEFTSVQRDLSDNDILLKIILRNSDISSKNILVRLLDKIEEKCKYFILKFKFKFRN